MTHAEGKFENGLLTVYLIGHIDSSNAADTEKEITDIKNEHKDAEIVLDAEKLEYISSAGLRIILRLRKEYANLKIVNVASEIYEVFEMTGFTDMMTVEKAYRKLSVEGCEVIGQGANGKVYRLDPDTIIKVYLNPDSLPDIQRERELARKAFVLGIPTAIPYDVVKVGDGYGSVFELLNAKSFAKLVISDPGNIDKYIALYVDLLKKIHSTVVKKGDMPDMKKVVVGWANFLKEYIPEDQFDKLVKLVNDVPDDDHMMHGDYHLKNVMMQNDEVLLIDMDTLCVGNPVFEFASIFLAYKGYSEHNPQILMDFMGLTKEQGDYIWEKTLELYFGTTDKELLKKMEDKAKVIGYTRYLRRTIRRYKKDDPEGQIIIKYCKEHLTELLAKVDSLCFDK